MAIERTFKIIKGKYVVVPATPPFVLASSFLDCAKTCRTNNICVGFNYVSERCYIYTDYSEGGSGPFVNTVYVKIGSRPHISGSFELLIQPITLESNGYML